VWLIVGSIFVVLAFGMVLVAASRRVRQGDPPTIDELRMPDMLDIERWL
jgi:hypothetical protein